MTTQENNNLAEKLAQKLRNVETHIRRALDTLHLQGQTHAEFALVHAVRAASAALSLRLYADTMFDDYNHELRQKARRYEYDANEIREDARASLEDMLLTKHAELGKLGD